MNNHNSHDATEANHFRKNLMKTQREHIKTIDIWRRKTATLSVGPRYLTFPRLRSLKSYSQLSDAYINGRICVINTYRKQHVLCLLLIQSHDSLTYRFYLTSLCESFFCFLVWFGWMFLAINVHFPTFRTCLNIVWYFPWFFLFPLAPLLHVYLYDKKTNKQTVPRNPDVARWSRQTY